MRVTDRDRLIEDAARLESLDELHPRLLSGLGRAVGASYVFAYRAAPHGVRAYLPPSAPDLVAAYSTEYLSECPLHKLKGTSRGAVVPTTARYGWQRLVRTRVYNELWRPHGLDHHVALRLDDAEQGGMGIMLNRDHRRGEFQPEELRALRSLIASLASALRRLFRLQHLETRVDALESILAAHGSSDARVVLDADGRVVDVCAPPAAARAIESVLDPVHPLRQAARGLWRPSSGPAGPLEHTIEPTPGERWHASLSVLETRLARPLVLISLRPAHAPAPAPGALSRAEQAVLDELLLGRTNLEIGQRLFISAETVRTHLTRIYKKLGVKSRLEAVVRARLRGSA